MLDQGISVKDPNALTDNRFSGVSTERRLVTACFLLLQCDQNRNQPLSFCEWSQRLADDCAECLKTFDVEYYALTVYWTLDNGD